MPQPEPPKPSPSKPEPKKPKKPAPTPSPERPLALIQAELAFFYQQHAAEAPTNLTPLFGFRPGDTDGVWDARSVDAMKGFQAWLNARNGLYKGMKRSMGDLPENGQPDAASVAALDSVVRKDLADLGLKKLPETPGLPTPPQLPELPGPKPPPGKLPEIPEMPAPQPKKEEGGGAGVAAAVGLGLAAALLTGII
jgi:hypothetical protein